MLLMPENICKTLFPIATRSLDVDTASMVEPEAAEPEKNPMLVI